MIPSLGDAIISLGFDKMSTVICTEQKHSLRHYSVLKIFPEENSSTYLGLPLCLFIFRLLADYEVPFKRHKPFYLVIIINRGF